MNKNRFEKLPAVIRGIVFKKAEENHVDIEIYLGDMEFNFTILTKDTMNPFPMWGNGVAFDYVVYGDKEEAESNMLEDCDLCVVNEEQAVVYLAGLATMLGYER